MKYCTACNTKYDDSVSFCALDGEVLEADPASIVNTVLDGQYRSEEHTSELQSQSNLVCRLLLEKKKKKNNKKTLKKKKNIELLNTSNSTYIYLITISNKYSLHYTKYTHSHIKVRLKIMRILHPHTTFVTCR